MNWSGQGVLGIKTAKGRSQGPGMGRDLVLSLSLITCVLWISISPLSSLK